MAIDDNANYTLTGAQVKDLASKVKASDPLIIYTDAAIGNAFQTYSDDNLTVVITGAQIGAAFKAGRQIILTTDTILEPTATIVAFTEGPEDMFTCVVDNTTYRYGYKSAQSRWVAVSRTVNDGTLTIQHNGTTVQTFTANQSTNATANIETIYADTIAPATPVAPITTDMIQDGAVTSTKIDWSTMGSVVRTDRVAWATSITFTMDSGCHALVMMSAGWAGYIWHYSGGFNLVSLHNPQYPPTMATSGDSVTLTANSNQTWTIFKNTNPS